jgi:GntR family transcriptional regulator
MIIEEYRSRPRDEIVERIECLMIERGFEPGDRIPSERELCETWNCNRMTFRAAVKRLVAEGKLITVSATGSFVAPKKLERYLQDLTSFTDFVMQKGYSIENKLINSHILPASKKMSEKLRIPVGSDVFELVRLRNVDHAPVMIETAQIPCQRYGGIQKYDFERFSLYSVLERKYSVIFGGGTEEISITYADLKEAELLQVNEGEALFYLKGLTWDENNEPIEIIKSVSRTDRIYFAGTLQ